MRRLSRLLPALCLAAGLALSPATAGAEGKSVIVLDASGSMWGQIDGRAKLEIAREALGSVLSGMDPATEIGLMAYGHRSKGDCADIEMVVPPAAGTGQAIIDAANAMKFLGKTPLTDAVRKAAEELKSTEAKATVILITDGIETCDADPCALGAELEASGVDFTAHVVGFGLTEEEGRAVACLADNTGGKYIQASDAGQLVDALKTTVVVAEPEPAPEPTPPAPAKVEENVDPLALLAEGVELPDDLADDVYFYFYPVAADGTVPDDHVMSIYGEKTGSLPAGTYMMRTTMDRVVIDQTITVTDTEVATPVVILDAGIFDIVIRATDDGEADPDAFWELRGPEDFTAYGYATGRQVVSSGEYALKVSLGAAELNESVVIEAGKVTEKRIIMGVGLAAVEAFYSDAMKVEGGDHFVEIFEAKAALDGTRKSVGYTYGAGATFDLPPGDYVAVVTLGVAVVETPFTIKSGERSDVKVVLNAGVGAFTFGDGNTYLEVFEAKKDINGNRKSVAYGYGPVWEMTFTGGDYVAVVDFGAGPTETPFTIKAAERLDLTIKAP